MDGEYSYRRLNIQHVYDVRIRKEEKYEITFQNGGILWEPSTYDFLSYNQSAMIRLFYTSQIFQGIKGRGNDNTECEAFWSKAVITFVNSS